MSPVILSITGSVSALFGNSLGCGVLGRTWITDDHGLFQSERPEGTRDFPSDAGLPARIVVYRRPVESRATDALDLADLVRDVVVEQVAHLLGRSPDDVDPHYGDAH